MNQFEVRIATGEYIEVADLKSGQIGRQYIKGRRPSDFRFVKRGTGLGGLQGYLDAIRSFAIDHGRAVRFID